MTGLCPKCGRSLCDCTPEERGQTEEEFNIDMCRDITPEELKAWYSGDDAKKLEVAKSITEQKKAGTFKPTFTGKFPDLENA